MSDDSKQFWVCPIHGQIAGARIPTETVYVNGEILKKCLAGDATCFDCGSVVVHSSTKEGQELLKRLKEEEGNE